MREKRVFSCFAWDATTLRGPHFHPFLVLSHNITVNSTLIIRLWATFQEIPNYISLFGFLISIPFYFIIHFSLLELRLFQTFWLPVGLESYCYLSASEDHFSERAILPTRISDVPQLNTVSIWHNVQRCVVRLMLSLRIHIQLVLCYSTFEKADWYIAGDYERLER